MYRDDHGNFVYVDRANRVINRHGLRISLVELSEAIRGLTNVTSAACIMFDHEGDVGIVAFVVTTKSTTPIELRRSALERLPEAMLPDRFEIVDALPMNKSNKLDEPLLLAGAGLSPLTSARDA
jgi:acyl-coenzyme A synthetase/AMP-(fatty) acid ligase